VALEEVPSLRTGFKHDPLLIWAAENRRSLALACLVLCRRWIADKMPQGPQVMGSYEAYARVMGGILGACGIDGFLANRPKAVKRDREATCWGALVNAWHKKEGQKPIPTADIWAMITAEGSELGEMFHEIIGDGTAASQKTRLGKAFDKYEGRVWGDWRIGRSSVKAANKGVM
jgi:putative DNA primase/helicase